MSFFTDSANNAKHNSPTKAEARPRGGPNRTRAPSAPRLEPSVVLSKTDIVELIGEVVELRPRGGKGEMLGKCPFHSDSRPSFEVNGQTGVYSCWSCSAGMNGSRGGDALTFMQRYHSVNFRQALEMLARRAGMAIPESTGATRPSGTPSPAYIPRAPIKPAEPIKGEPNLKAEKSPLYAAMSKVQDIFATKLNQSQAAIEYLFHRRGISPELLGRYCIGFAPPGFAGLKDHFDEYRDGDLLIDAGLTREKKNGGRYDFFRDRIMFGVRDDEGRVIAFGGRRMSDEDVVDAKGEVIRTPKYLNSPETAIFSKREAIFGWHEAQKDVHDQGHVLVVEGYLDVLGLASQNINNAVATMGTALTEGHVQTILHKTKNIVFCFDGDTAGQQGAFRSLSGLFTYLDNDVSVRFLTLPDQMDPDEYVRKHGRASFLKHVSNAKSLPQFWEDALSALYPPSPDMDKQQLWRNAQDLINLLPDDSVHRPHLNQIASRLAGKGEIEQLPAHARRGLSNFAANEPSDRLYLAAMKMPIAASEVRPELVRMQSGMDPALMPALAAWQAKFDQAIAAGLVQIGELSPIEIRQYEAIIGAATSILTQHLNLIKRDQVVKARKEGLIDSSTYLRTMGRSSFAKPK